MQILANFTYGRKLLSREKLGMDFGELLFYGPKGRRVAYKVGVLDGSVGLTNSTDLYYFIVPIPSETKAMPQKDLKSTIDEIVELAREHAVQLSCETDGRVRLFFPTPEEEILIEVK